jgi:hypothetical protein
VHEQNHKITRQSDREMITNLRAVLDSTLTAETQALSLFQRLFDEGP